MNLARRAMQGAIWNALENIGSQLTSFILFLIFARLIAPGEIGVIQIVTTLLGFFTIFVEQGFASRIIRVHEASPKMLSTAFWMGLGGAAGLTVVLTPAASLIADWYRTPEVGPVLRALAWTICLTTLSSVQTALLIRDLAFRTQALRRLLAVAGGGIAGVILAVQGYGVWSLVVRLTVEVALSCVIAWWWTDWRPSWTFSRTEAKEFVSFGSRVVGSYSVAFLSRRADELLIGFVLGSTALGYYAVAARAVSLVTEVALRAAERTAIPVFSRLQDDVVRMREAYCSAVELASALACPVFIGMSAVAPELCLTLYGKAWEPVIPVMQILGFAGAALSLTVYTGPLLIAIGRADWLLRYTLAETVVNFVTAAVFVKFGIVAVAIALVARSYIILPVTMFMTKRIIGTGWFQTLRLIAAPTAASLLMYAAVFYLRREISMPPVPRLLVLVSAGALVYCAGMWMLGRSTLGRFMAILQVVRR